MYNRLDRAGVAARGAALPLGRLLQGHRLPRAARPSTSPRRTSSRSVNVALRRGEGAAPGATTSRGHVVRARPARRSPRPSSTRTSPSSRPSPARRSSAPRWKRCVAATDRAARRAARAALRSRTNFTPESKEATERYVHEIAAAFGAEVEKLELDGRRHQGPRRREAQGDGLPHRLPEEVEDVRLRRQAQELPRQRARRPRRGTSKRALAKVGKPVDREEWRHDAAHRERLLQPAAQPHGLPRGHPPAAVLQPEGERPREPRRHGHGRRATS